MRYGTGLGQNGGAMRAEPETRMPAPAPGATKEIPYDYVATFKLKGEPGNRVQDVINVSTEGSFVAVAIGYSLVPARLPLPDVTLTAPGVVLAAGGALSVNGVTIGSANETFGVLVGLPDPVFNPAPPKTPTDGQLLARSIVLCQLMKLCGIDFKYSVVDSGSGRELQNQAIHNIAGLGSADGNRPFRPFARPALFAPRSTIRIEVEEISEGLLYRDAQLFIVLHGYKRLGE
jgi:hypothetical protein